MSMLSRRRFLAGLPIAYSSALRAVNTEEETFLDDLSRRAFLYFWEQADEATGLVRDRALADSSIPDERPQASSAATGFGLAALCIGAERGWVSREQARARGLAALRFYAEKSVHERGWFYHFVHVKTGERYWKCEISSIDTALLLAGMLVFRGYFDEDPDIARLVRTTWDRIDYRWMLNGDPRVLSMGWHPESGFIKSRWDHHCELGILYLQGMAAAANPLPLESWYAWRRPLVSYGRHRFISGAPALFVHQYSQAFVDFRGKREKRGFGTDWFENSRRATLAHRRFCLDLRAQFPGYSENIWGITASDSAKGYVAWGGPPKGGPIDGTVVPCAAAGSLMFAPEVCLPALLEMREKFGERIYQRYGFVDAFHPTNGWTNPDVIGIDVGITLLSAENLRTGNVWRWFAKSPEMLPAMQQIFV